MHLCLKEFSKGKPYFANRVVAKRAYPVHSQDFHEVMHISSGSGTHLVNGVSHPLRSGQNWHITLNDLHSIEPDKGGLSWMNVAFPIESWRDFIALTKLDVQSG